MPTYWGNKFSHMGDSPKWVKSKRRRERGPNDGDNNCQAMHGARKHAWRTQAAWANLKSLLHVRTIPMFQLYHFRIVLTFKQHCDKFTAISQGGFKESNCPQSFKCLKCAEWS